MLKLTIMLYILFSFLLIVLILINKGKGAEMGGITNSETDIFGSTGSNNILNKLIIFTSILLLLLNIFINITNNKLNSSIIKSHINMDNKKIINTDFEKN